MAQKNLSIILNAQHIYIPLDHKNNESHFVGLFQSISGTYIPLLNMFESLERDCVKFKISMVFSPSLCTMLCDPVIQEKYIEWLDRRIAFGTQEMKRCEYSEPLLAAAKFFLAKAKQDRFDFTEKYEQNLIKHFSLYAAKGFLEILATAATPIFLPYYADLPEAVNAQIETGLYAQKYFFGQSAQGFWLPYLGYTKGLENSLRAYGFQYTVLDSQGLLFSETEPVNGLFTPVRCNNSLSVFGRDTENHITTGEGSFRSAGVYCNTQKDAGFELSIEDLKAFGLSATARQATGFCYWNNTAESALKSKESGGNGRGIYDPQAAYSRAEADALQFLQKKKSRLEAAEKEISVPQLSLVCAYKADDIGTNWLEGAYWLETVIRSASDMGLVISNLSDLLPADLKLQKIVPYPSAAYGYGYGENLLDSSNSWMMRYVRKATERMIDLAGRFPSDTGLKARLLNLGAREVLLAQSSEWANMIQEENEPDYAEEFFKKCIAAFTTVFDSLGSNTVSTEWLTNLERKHSIFPWMNYRIFSRKK
ncbi:1,4-alpha-glucan branching protein domain-containing protein [Treponema parvum]|uniref:1,4-alpha-glucan branching protein domain-containing protein n=1 Tax=Treponema parvum TaxID=138851 RepID=UPI001AEBF1F2|nr:1,4-alpha-glucan branching protein domain-containing protein [Treponema parvum]QTQ16082.1 DUF1957 domain-containing protein [Treponema parvum]